MIVYSYDTPERAASENRLYHPALATNGFVVV